MEQLFNQYYQELVYFGQKFVKDKQVVEEIVADVFVKEKIKPDIDPRRQLYVVVKRRCIDYWRISQRHKRCMEKYEPDICVMDIELDFIEADLLKIIKNSLDKLPHESRQIIKLYYFDGMEINEISKVINKPPNTVRSIKRYALNRLKLILNIDEIKD